MTKESFTGTKARQREDHAVREHQGSGLWTGEVVGSRRRANRALRNPRRSAQA